MANKKVKLSGAAKKLLNLVPLDGTFIGNKKLQRRSKLGKGYWKVQKELVGKGVLTRGKGRGGSVARLAADRKLGWLARKRKVQYEKSRSCTNRSRIGWPRNGEKMSKGATSLMCS